MPFATIAKLGAGSVLSYVDPDDTTDTYVDLTNALEIGEVGEQGEFVETTPIAEEVREYIAGMETPPDKTIVFNDIPGNANYEAFMVLVRARSTIEMRVTYSNGRIADFTIVMAGSMMQQPEGGAQLKMNVFGKQSGAAAWSEDA